MDRKSTWLWVSSPLPAWFGTSRPPHCARNPTQTLRLGRGDTLILVLLLSPGLWALIWGAVSVLAACGLR